MTSAYAELFELATTSPLTLVIALTMVAGLPVDSAMAMTELVQQAASNGDDEWYELLLASSFVSVG